MTKMILSIGLLVMVTSCSIDFGASEKVIDQIAQLVNERNGLHSKLAAGLESSNVKWAINNLEKSLQKGNKDEELLQQVEYELNRSKKSAQDRLNKTKQINKHANQLKNELHDMSSARKQLATQVLNEFIALTTIEIKQYEQSIEMNVKNKRYYHDLVKGRQVPTDDYDKMLTAQLQRDVQIRKISDRFNDLWDSFVLEVKGEKIKEPGPL